VYKSYWILVEGPDDESYAKGVIAPLVKNKYHCDYVHIYRYQNRPKKEVQDLLKSILAMGEKVLCFADIDECPCVTSAKDRVRRKKFNDLPDDQIVIVQKEIEGWYLAGLDDISCKKLGFPRINTTEDLCKEEFNNMVKHSHDKFRSSVMQEMLRLYDLDIAIAKNKSIKYVYYKHFS